jgi:hypothetical protein
MAYDERLAATLRSALAGEPAVTERRMFGGLCFMLGGHMVAGAFRHRGMVRVGNPAALAVPQTGPMSMAGRPMPGIVEIEAAAILDPAIRGRLLALAVGFVRDLPPERGGQKRARSMSSAPMPSP